MAKLLLLAFCVVLCGCSTVETKPVANDLGASSVQQFQPGQIWHYKTRPTETDSKLTILKVETDPKLGVIVHIRLDGLSIQTPEGVKREIAHMPFSEKSVRESISNLVETTSTIPPFQEGYKNWKDANGGIWALSVSKSVDAMESVMKGSGK